MTDHLLIPKKEESRIIYGKIRLPPEYNRSMRLDRLNLSKLHFDPNNPNQMFKISPFTKIFEGDEGIALFHSYLSKKMFGDDNLKKCLKDIEETGTGDPEILKKLAENEFIIPRSFSEKEFKEEFVKNFGNCVYNPTPSIGLMYFILTDRCNYGCRYCFIEKGALKSNPRYGDMSYETAKASVDFFINQLKSPGQKTIIFYGGEPLLNFDVMKENCHLHTRKGKARTFQRPCQDSSNHKCVSCY